MRKTALLAVLVLLVLCMCFAAGAATAEEGTLGIEFYHDYRQPFFVLDSSDVDTRLLSTHVERYEELLEEIGGRPTWTVTPVDPDNVPFNWICDPRDEEVILWLDHDVYVPDLPVCAVSFDIGCEWGDYSKTERVTLNFDFLPSGMPDEYANLPASITVKTGDVVDFRKDYGIELLPQGWTYPAGFEPDLHVFAGREVNGVYVEGLIESEGKSFGPDQVGYFTYTAGAPGVYNASPVFYLANATKFMGDIMLTVTDSDGNVPAEPLLLNIDVRHPYYIDVDRGDAAVLSVNIDNYEQHARTHSGDPVITITQTDGVAFDWYQESGEPQWAIAIRDGIIKNAGTATFHITCAWDDDLVEKDATVELANLPNGMPAAIHGLPDSITVKTGEIIKYFDEISFEPEGWSVPAGSSATLSCYAVYYNSYNWTDEAIIWNDWRNMPGEMEGCAEYMAGQPGHYRLGVEFWINNVNTVYEIELTITDEEGNVPEEPEGGDNPSWPSDGSMWLNVDTRDTYYIDTEQGDAGIFTVSIENYDEIAGNHVSDPVFTITQTDGVAFDWYQDSYDPWLAVVIREGLIHTPGEATFHIVCTWDDEVKERDCTVNLVRMPGGTPAGITGLPESITVKTGEMIDYYSNIGIAPDSWTVPEGAWSYFDCWTNYYSNYDWTDDAIIREDWADLSAVNGCVTYRAGKPGHYHLNVELWVNNACFMQPVELFITDEDGNVPPDPEGSPVDHTLRLHMDTREPYYIDNDSGDWGVLGVNIEDYDLLAKEHTSDPVFTIKQTDGVAFEWYQIMAEPNYAIIVRDEMIPSTGTATFHIVCTWDDETVEDDAIVNFALLPNGEPEGITGLPKSITVKTGDPIDYISSIGIAPAGWTVPSGSWSYFSCWTNRYSDSESADDAIVYDGWCEAISIVNGYNRYYAGDPGHYYLNVEFWVNNLCYLEPVELIVTDANGVCPDLPDADLPEIDSDKVLLLPEELTTIEAEAFSGGKYEAVVCPDGLVTIGSGAFAGSALRVITIPASVTSIADDAFVKTSLEGFICDKDSYAEQYARDHGVKVQYR